MASWNPARSVLLSQLLDDVVGTEEMVRIRQDYCRIYDFVHSAGNINTYYTGSKAEGLDLPGSDDDYMLDINNVHDMQIFQTQQDALLATHRNVFVMSTENVPPCFAMLRSVRQIHDMTLFNACQDINNSLHLSSFLYVQNARASFSEYSPDTITSTQGPSIEGWNPYMDRSQSGKDTVRSIHCSFWPYAAMEWKTRPRRSPWPDPCDINTIVDFGFHLVPVGHPHSDTNMMEWRISFSVAERTLAWSFNHIQMQCYAVMKLILKEFINPHCSPQCRVLCSYFIKTFLFWEYEETDLSYWCKENFRQCVMRLLSDFCECLSFRSLKHYFIPNFNLLSVKMTDEAQMELLEIFDIILKYDICIVKECKTLNKVGTECLHHNADTTDDARTVSRNLLRNDVCMMNYIDRLHHVVLKLTRHNCVNFLILPSQYINHFFLLHVIYKTHLPSFAIRILLTHASIQLTYIPLQSVGNRTFYGPRRFLQSNVSGIDISTNRLWYSMLMTKCGDYLTSLRIVNKVLSNISPFALYKTESSLRRVSNEIKQRYVDMFSSHDSHVKVRAKRAWMFDLQIMASHMDMVPAAIQIELLHCDKDLGVFLSPFVCAYYLMFLNYCGLRQYDNRDRKLRQLIDVVNDKEQCGLRRWHSYNIAGYCLLSVGETEQARDMFMRSYLFTLPDLLIHRCNSAQYYLQCLSNNAKHI